MNIPDELLFEEVSFDGIYSIATLMHYKEKYPLLQTEFNKISIRINYTRSLNV